MASEVGMDYYVEIKNFGAIKEARIDLTKRFQILVGPQASGKSTVYKVIYFCRKIRDYSLEYLNDPELIFLSHKNELLGNYYKYLTKKFMSCFGTTKHMGQFSILYCCGTERIKITLVDGYVRFEFSENLREGIKGLLSEVFDIFKSMNNQAMLLSDVVRENGMLRQRVSVRLNTLFGDDSDIVFIPAGRSVLATLSEQLQDIPYPSMDLIMQEFINRIRDTRRNFGSRIPEIIQDYLKTVKGQINNSAVNLAYELIHEILRADYVSDKGEEKIYYDESHWVKLLFASSGQQESLWLLLPCFMQILQQRKSLFIIEEPEAHLFPYAQRNIMELIALLANATNSTVLISTHSPYILTSTNLLLYSGAVEKQNSQRDAVIRPMLRIMPSIFSAFSIDNGKLTDLFDEETSMIMAEYIDSVSTVINEDLDRLMEKEGA